MLYRLASRSLVEQVCVSDIVSNLQRKHYELNRGSVHRLCAGTRGIENVFPDFQSALRLRCLSDRLRLQQPRRNREDSVILKYFEKNSMYLRENQALK